jgi:transcriptional regulator with XRE-family HTH domain
MRLDTSAFLAVLLSSTGLTQTDAAALLHVDARTVRRWLEGTRPTPKVAIEHLRGFANALDQAAQAITTSTGAPALLLLYRRDRDVPPWTGLRTAGCHLALVRRVSERRPDIQLIAFDRVAYRWWLRDRTDSEDMRAAWAASRV